jgi:glutamine amidotransferase
MGWNTLDVAREHKRDGRALPLGPQGRHAYFVHSYQLNTDATRPDCIVATSPITAVPVTAIVGADNIDRHSVSSREEPGASVWR